MSDFDNTNRGALFKNNDKRTERSPDYSGNVNVDGVEFFLDAWIKEGRNGKFMSVSVKRKDKQPEAARQPAPRPAQGNRAPQRQPQGTAFDDMDSDVPF